MLWNWLGREHVLFGFCFDLVFTQAKRKFHSDFTQTSEYKSGRLKPLQCWTGTMPIFCNQIWVLNLGIQFYPQHTRSSFGLHDSLDSIGAENSGANSKASKNLISVPLFSKVFFNSTEMVYMGHRWKRRLNNAGLGEIPVNFLTGNSTAEQKEMVMNNFRSGYYNFCWEQIGRPAEKLLVPGILVPGNWRSCGNKIKTACQCYWVRKILEQIQRKLSVCSQATIKNKQRKMWSRPVEKYLWDFGTNPMETEWS